METIRPLLTRHPLAFCSVMTYLPSICLPTVIYESKESWGRSLPPTAWAPGQATITTKYAEPRPRFVTTWGFLGETRGRKIGGGRVKQSEVLTLPPVQSSINNHPSSILNKLCLAGHGHRRHRQIAELVRRGRQIQLRGVQRPIPLQRPARICAHPTHNGGQGAFSDSPTLI